ncbi:hypothetical protein CI41S_44780 [Bradyrhizobium ivorense]|nr:hypothetical protein CI41S_44780 [Bradyrhizobium ivorense]
MGFRRVDAELEIELGRGKGRFTKHCGGDRRGAGSQHILRVMAVVFIIVFLPGAVWTWARFGPQAALGKPPAKPNRPRDETISENPRNDPETDGPYESMQQTARRRPEAIMNHSIHSADRSTHLKIVVVALVAGIAVAALGISARNNADFTQTAQSTQVIKAGKPVAITSSGTSTVR